MSEPIVSLPAEYVARLYDALHLARTVARDDYVAAEHMAPEEHARGRRDGLDEALTLLDELVDAAAARL